MFSLLGWIHIQLFRLVFWAVKLPLKALLATFQAMVALLGEEFQRWAGIFVSGLMVYGIAKVSLMFSYPGKKWVLLTVALMGCAWLFALMKSISYTIHNNLRAVRTRQMFRKLDKRTAQIPEQAKAIKNATAKKAKGTPVELAWSANRSARREEREKAEQAAEQSEVDRRIAAEKERRTAAEQVEHDRELEVLAQEHDPFSDHRR